MGWIKKSTYVVLTFLAVMFGLVLYYHNAVFVLVGPDNGFLLTKTETVRYSVYLPAFYVHIFTGSIVLILGVIQLSKKIRTHYSMWHRLAGKIYIFVILIFTAPTGFVMALYANGGLAVGCGFALLALLWWFFTWKGFVQARYKNWKTHRAFMMRSYALTFAAVTLRLYSFFFALAGYRGESVYVLVVWLSWIPSLVIMEIYLRQNTLKGTTDLLPVEN